MRMELLQRLAPRSAPVSLAASKRFDRYKPEDKKIVRQADVKGDEIDKRHQNGILSGIGTSLTYDSTDRAMKPHRGLRSTMEGEFVGVGGSCTFLRGAYMNAYYTPLWQRGFGAHKACESSKPRRASIMMRRSRTLSAQNAVTKKPGWLASGRKSSPRFVPRTTVRAAFWLALKK